MALYPQNAFVNIIMNSISAIGLFYNGTELSGGNYARVSITPATQLQVSSDTTNYYIRTTTTLTFPQASADWGTFNQIGVFAGNDLWFLIDVPSRTVRMNDQVFISTGQLQLTIPKSIT
jgi:hypothetical protein